MARVVVHPGGGFYFNFKIINLGLSLKAIGLYVRIMSLARNPNWSFSVEGLVAVSKEGQKSILEGLRELEKAGLLRRGQERTESGKLAGAVWDLYEDPAEIQPGPDEPSVDYPLTEKPSGGKPSDGKPLDGKPLGGKAGQIRELEIRDRRIMDKGIKEIPMGCLTVVEGGVKKPTKKELLYQAVLEIYNQNKPANWPKKRGITGETKSLLDKKFKQLAMTELEFVEMLANALQRCQVDPFPRDNYSLNTLLRGGSTHLTDLSESHISSRPVSNSKGYNTRADRTATTRQEFLDRFSGLEKPSKPAQPSFMELFGSDDDA